MVGDYKCVLLQILHEGRLIAHAMKIHNDRWPIDEGSEWSTSTMSKLHDLLPSHIKNLGPVVDVQEIFDISLVLSNF
jgi:hypothetical protein